MKTLQATFTQVEPIAGVHKTDSSTEISFAWEARTPDYDRLLREAVQDTHTLAIIGYSFPIYNRKYDKRLLNEYMPGLKRIYIQDKLRPEIIRDRFLAIRPDITQAQITLNNDGDQFLFPNELNL